MALCTAKVAESAGIRGIYLYNPTHILHCGIAMRGLGPYVAPEGENKIG